MTNSSIEILLHPIINKYKDQSTTKKLLIAWNSSIVGTSLGVVVD
jgi:hypothetical protein